LTTVAVKEVQSTTVVLAARAETAVRDASVTVGMLTYGYKVAAIQNFPDGPITAASAAQTVTQAAQAPLNDVAAECQHNSVHAQ
jgi:hypothetical protein